MDSDPELPGESEADDEPTLRVSLLPPEQKLTANRDSPYKPHPNTFLGRIRFILQLPPTPPLYETVEVLGLLILMYGLVVGLGYFIHHHLPAVDSGLLPTRQQINFTLNPAPLPTLDAMNPGFNITQAMLVTAYLSSLGPHPYSSENMRDNVRPFLEDYLGALSRHAGGVGRTLLVADDIADSRPPLIVVDSKSTPFGLGTFFRPTNLAVRLLGARSTRGEPSSSILLTTHYDTPTLSPGSSSPSGLGVGALLALLASLIASTILDSDLVVLLSGMGTPSSHLSAPGSVAFRGLPHHFYPMTGVHVHLDSLPFSGFHCRWVV
jgi:hypothetical protein